MDLLFLILKFVFVVTVMIAIGLKTSISEVLAVLRNTKFIVKILLGNIILVPIFGLILVKVFHLSADTTIAILLLSVAPGGIIAIQFTSKVRDAVACSAAVLFLLSIASVILTPLMASFIVPQDILKELPYLQILGLMGLFLLLPLMVGFAIHNTLPVIAEKISMPLNLISTISFTISLIISMSVKEEASRAIGLSGIAAMLILVLGSMIIGWFLGGPEKRTRKVIAIATSMRNVALCLLIAHVSFPGRAIDVVILAFVMVLIPPNLLFSMYHIVKSKRKL